MWRQYAQLPRAVHVLCLGTLINRAGTLIIPFLTLYLTGRLQFTEDFATLCMAAYGLGGIGAVLVGGHLADAVGRRAVMLVALFGGAAAIAVLAYLRAGWAIFTGVLAFAFLMEMFRPAASAMIADLVEPERRSTAYGLQYIAVNLGFAVAAALGGRIAQGLGYGWLFGLDAATAAIFGLIVLSVMSETRPAVAAEPDAPTLTGGRAASLSAVQAYAGIFRDGSYMAFAAATFLLAAVYMQAMSTFPLHLRAFDIDEGAYGAIIALNGIMIVVFQVPVLALTGRFRRSHVFCAAAILTALGFALTGLARTPVQFAGTVAVWTFGEIMSAPYTPAVVSDLAPVHLRARYMGVLSMTFALGGVVGIPIGGLILQHFGGATLWTGTLVLSLAAAALYFVIRHQLSARTPTTTEKAPDVAE